VTHLEESFIVSERRACNVTGQHRSTQRYAARQVDGESVLLARMDELVKDNPRRGCRYITALLRREGWAVNYKRVHRLWKREGYKVPRKRHKKRAVGDASNACDIRAATGPNDVWTWDFIHDRLVDGRALKCLTIVDEYTRECLELGMGRSIQGEDVLDVLSRLIGQRGAPGHIRSDNGSEFIAERVRTWLLRDEFLEMNYFTTVTEAKRLALSWKEHYNTKRLHGSLGYLTPAEYARRCGACGSASLRSAPPTAPQRKSTTATP